MSMELEPSLTRWVEAQLIDADQARRIRAFETAQAPVRRARWPVIVALAFGGIMLAAGILLFVSAHWDELSPAQRMTILVAAVGGFHLAGAFAQERFPALAITMHAAGTVSLGGAIALAGQIFNMQEHWPTGMLLWAAGAVCAWVLLGHWPQMGLAAILVPAWLIGEWTEAAPSSGWRVAAAGVLLLAFSYLTTSRPVLVWLGGIALLPSAFALSLEGGTASYKTGTGLLVVGWAAAILLPLAVAALARGVQAWINGVAAMWVVVLGFLGEQRAELAVYGWCALGAAG